MPVLSIDDYEAYLGYPDFRFSSGYHRKTVDFETYSPCHRTTVAFFVMAGIPVGSYGCLYQKGFLHHWCAQDKPYYVYHYEGKLNGIENAVVLLSYPKDAFHEPNPLRAFISTDVFLSTREILDRYVERHMAGGGVFSPGKG